MKVPYTNFKTRIGDTDAVGGCTFIGGEWKDKDTTEYLMVRKLLYLLYQGHSHLLVLVNNYLDMKKNMMKSKH